MPIAATHVEHAVCSAVRFELFEQFFVSFDRYGGNGIIAGIKCIMILQFFFRRDAASENKSAGGTFHEIRVCKLLIKHSVFRGTTNQAMCVMVFHEKMNHTFCTARCCSHVQAVDIISSRLRLVFQPSWFSALEESE